jgi:c-di-GMP-binding flagellar brake protein YcgR
MSAEDFKLGLAERLLAAARYLREAGELLSRELWHNRRHARRREVRVPVTFSLHNGAESGDYARTAYTRDLSATGLSLLLPSELTRGSVLDLTLQLPHAPVRAAATVVRCEPLDERDVKAGYLVAAEFTRMGGEDRQRLRRHLSRQHPF